MVVGLVMFVIPYIHYIDKRIPFTWNENKTETIWDEIIITIALGPIAIGGSLLFYSAMFVVHHLIDFCLFLRKVFDRGWVGRVNYRIDCFWNSERMLSFRLFVEKVGDCIYGSLARFVERCVRK